ncbi:MAG: hypothetical protein INR71_00350 [Terriglobus roseus]|nr:hypothetical protein [Terriglobus roseus]
MKRRRSPPPDEPPAHPHPHARRTSISASPSEDEDEDGDGDIGPTPLRSLTTTNNDPTRRSGPTIPSRSDLTLRNELLSTESSAHRHAQHLERQADRALRRSRLDDLQPRADAGSRERRLEKRAETREANASFAAARESGGYADDAEEGDGDVLGGGGAEDYARERREVQRKKTEREVRREEVWRARAAEREERVREAREREERTMEGLRRIARERFGGVPGGDGPSAAG